MKQETTQNLIDFFFCVFLVISIVAIYDWFFNNPSYYTVSGEIIDTEYNWGGCQHTDWTYIKFDDGSYYYWNPSVEIIDNLPLNRSYTFYLQDFDYGDGPGTWLDRIDNEYGDEIWRSCRYE